MQYIKHHRFTLFTAINYGCQPFHMLQLVKSLPFPIPFLAEPSRIVHYIESPPLPRSGCTPSSANHIKSLDNSTATAVIFLNKVALEKLRHLDTSIVGWQSKPRHRPTEIRFCCFKSLKIRLSYWASTSAIINNIINKLHAAKVSWMTTSLYKTLSFRAISFSKGCGGRGGISNAHVWHVWVRTFFQDY